MKVRGKSGKAPRRDEHRGVSLDLKNGKPIFPSQPYTVRVARKGRLRRKRLMSLEKFLDGIIDRAASASLKRLVRKYSVTSQGPPNVRVVGRYNLSEVAPQHVEHAAGLLDKSALASPTVSLSSSKSSGDSWSLCCP